ncbi:alkaline phosphatase family protein [Amorphus sp. 3PC139-8]|uniref:alkaline phosphatase family protein n=1 Tax=Amorphus sp. 3PC139-8 TaxID=2735676 RepID=UPI00345DDB00
MSRVIAIMLDGLRRDFVRPEFTPNLARFAERAAVFEAHRSVFPSATRVVSAAFATGCHPARNGLHGNSMALMEDSGLVVHDAGKPDFLQHKRAVTGRTLATPTMAERLAPRGGAVVFNNVSPGAAYAHDPDGHGRVYHRAGSFGPGRVPVAESDRLDISLGIEGDREMTRRFLDEAVARDPALSVLWLSEPDTSQHASPLGSPEHLDTLNEADALAGAVIDAVTMRVADGEDILLSVGSDHGHQTVTETVDLEACLVAAGLKESLGSDDVVVAANGTAALIYVAPDHADQIDALAAHLRGQSWAGEVISGADLAAIGQHPTEGPAIAVSMAASDAKNDYGVPGLSAAVKPAAGKADRAGCGQHGGLGRHEQSPVLMLAGRGFRPGVRRDDETSVVDLAPTFLAHLGLLPEGLDGRALQADPLSEMPEF